MRGITRRIVLRLFSIAVEAITISINTPRCLLKSYKRHAAVAPQPHQIDVRFFFKLRAEHGETAVWRFWFHDKTTRRLIALKWKAYIGVATAQSTIHSRKRDNCTCLPERFELLELIRTKSEWYEYISRVFWSQYIHIGLLVHKVSEPMILEKSCRTARVLWWKHTEKERNFCVENPASPTLLSSSLWRCFFLYLGR